MQASRAEKHLTTEVQIAKAQTKARVTIEETTATPDSLEMWRSLDSLHREIDRIFEHFTLRPSRPTVRRTAFDIEPASWIAAPAINYVERDNAFEITADLPGVDEKSFEVKLVDGVLTIKGEKKQEKEGGRGVFLLRERRFGAFSRSLRVADTVDADRIEVTFQRGVLTVMLPKALGGQNLDKKSEVRAIDPIGAALEEMQIVGAGLIVVVGGRGIGTIAAPKTIADASLEPFEEAARLSTFAQFVSSRLGIPIEKVSIVRGAGDLDRSLAAARERGSKRAAEVVSGEDMLTANEMARLLGTTRMTINTKRRSHLLLGLEGATRGFRFPRWQIGEDGKPFAALPALFDRLGGNPWSVYRFLVQHHPELDGLTGREALARGRSTQAIEVAESVAQAFG